MILSMSHYDRRAASGDDRSRIVRSSIISQLAVVEVLLAAGADVTARTNDGTTVLHRAVESFGNIDVIHRLLAAGADPARSTTGAARHCTAPPSPLQHWSWPAPRSTPAITGAGPR